MKIALAGCAGTGRNIIAQRLAEKLSVGLVTGVVKEILDREHFQTSEVQVEQFLATPERQQMIFDYKKEVEGLHENFVVDRSWIDQAAYAIIERSEYPDRGLCFRGQEV
jgi:cytidylate kinase